MNRLQKLLARLAELKDQAGALTNAASEDGRDLTDEEARRVDQLLAEAESLKPQIEREERLVALAETTGGGGNRRTLPEPSNSGLQASGRPGTITTPLPTAQQRAQHDFHTLQDFARAVRNHAIGGGVDPRLMNAATTYGSEGVGADGGFAVPPAWREQINSLTFGEDEIMSRCDLMPTESNGVTVPVDEDPAWGSSSGIRVYTRAEHQAFTQSKPALKLWKCDLTTVYAFVPLTDELLSDAPLLQNFLTRKAAEKINFKLNDLIINGIGGTNPLGILNSPSLVTVSKESSQAANTVLAANILKMWARMPARLRGQAVWLINQDVEPQIHQLGLTISNPAGTQLYGGAPMFLPPGGMTEAPSGTLMGRPILPTEACQALSAEGDIILAYLPGYGLPYKSSGLKSDVSMHLYFDTGETAFRWSLRMGGQPWLSSPIARKNGSNTLSHFVTLEAR